MSDEPRETRKAVQAYMVRAMCPRCGDELEATGLSLACFPPLYEHKCPNVNAYEHAVEERSRTFNLDKTYPCLEYQEL